MVGANRCNRQAEWILELKAERYIAMYIVLMDDAASASAHYAERELSVTGALRLPAKAGGSKLGWYHGLSSLAARGLFVV
jgi:hypothetical protein